MSHPTRYWHLLSDGRVQCDVCPRACKLHEGQRGLCFVRAWEGHALVLTNYGRSSGFCVDPIEKKPLNLPCPAHPCCRSGRPAATWHDASARTGTSPNRGRSTRSPTLLRPSGSPLRPSRSDAAASLSPTTTRSSSWSTRSTPEQGVPQLPRGLPGTTAVVLPAVCLSRQGRRRRCLCTGTGRRWQSRCAGRG